MATQTEKFYGCYCLVSANPKYKGMTYIGFTVDPNRRVNQHNIGKKSGGANRTSGKGPWDMVLIIHGFLNMVSALQFEWVWQHPKRSTKLKHVNHKNLTGFKHRFAVVSEMLRTGPWNRLPLTIRWLNQDFVTEFDINCQPPTHMPIVYGPVQHVINRTPKTCSSTTNSSTDCYLCRQPVLCNEKLTCLVPACTMESHIVCLAENFLAQEAAIDMLLPVGGECPLCHTNILWGDLIRHSLGISTYISTDKGIDHDDADDSISSDHWGTQLVKPS